MFVLVRHSSANFMSRDNLAHRVDGALSHGLHCHRLSRSVVLEPLGAPRVDDGVVGELDQHQFLQFDQIDGISVSEVARTC